MAKTREQKKQIVQDYIDKIESSKALFIITPTQITPNEANTLRKQLRESKAVFNVIKNSLFKIALEKTKAQLQDMDFADEKAVVFVQGEASESAKALYNFLKEVKKGEIKGGLLDNSPLTQVEIEELALLPAKDIMIATTVRTIGAPLSSFVNVLNANITNLVNVLQNIREDKKE